MSWSKNYSGRIADVRREVQAEVDPYSGGEPATETQSHHHYLFERGKVAVLAELNHHEHADHSTGYVKVSFHGSGSYSASGMTHDGSYTVGVTRIAKPAEGHVGD